MHPDDVSLTVVNTPWGLYKLVIMPMGIKNTPVIQQCQVTEALHPHTGCMCHVYIDNIAVWSWMTEEHTQNVMTILQALTDHKLYVNPKKTNLFSIEIRFLGHQITVKGIKADKSKTDHIKNWPILLCTKHVWAFLGLVHYLSTFLPKLADHTQVLDELTTKECDKRFLGWTGQHQVAFYKIKTLVLSTNCLTTIDPLLMLRHIRQH